MANLMSLALIASNFERKTNICESLDDTQFELIRCKSVNLPREKYVPEAFMRHQNREFPFVVIVFKVSIFFVLVKKWPAKV